MSYKTITTLLSIILVAGCNKPRSPLEDALHLSGKNRPELEKVLSHYSDAPSDSLKLRAARFLIENMPVHCYEEKDPELFEIMDSLNQSELSKDEIYVRFDSIQKNAINSKPEIFSDLQSLSSGFLIKHIDAVFSIWEQTPWKSLIAFDNFCEYILPYAVSREKREPWTDYYRNKYLPFVSEKIRDYDNDSLNLIKICIALNDSLNVLSPMSLHDESLTDYPPLSVDHIRFGACDNYIARTIYLMRSLGMPVGKDFAPQWGSYNRPHSWNTLLAEDGRHYPFSGFDDGINQWHLDYRIDCPKIFRLTYTIQKESLAALQPGEKIPGFLNQSNLKDVTKEYVPVSDVTITVNKNVREKVVYLCVFNNITWIPVHWGIIKQGQVTFTDMGRKVVYLPAYYTGNVFVEASSPFLLDSLGQAIPLRPGDKKETLFVERKFHVRKLEQIFLPRMVNGRFSGANHPEFSDEKTLYRIPELPKPSFNMIDLDGTDEYRYVRYRADSTNYPDIAEMEFYTKEGNQYRRLTGKVIGTEGSAYDPVTHGKEVAFDGDWLTFFSHHGEGAWVGMDFGRKEKIARIRFLPRNDDNSIRPGDLYELFYRDNGKWNSLGKKTGDESGKLVYENCPSGVLFLLHNHTRGKEERIFTYENGKQIFW